MIYYSKYIIIGNYIYYQKETRKRIQSIASCFKFGSECGLCCQNLFNHFEYFYGNHEKCSANPCFAKL
jgi:hypothetical protein